MDTRGFEDGWSSWIPPETLALIYNTNVTNIHDNLCQWTRYSPALNCSVVSQGCMCVRWNPEGWFVFAAAPFVY